MTKVYHAKLATDPWYNLPQSRPQGAQYKLLSNKIPPTITNINKRDRTKGEIYPILFQGKDHRGGSHSSFHHIVSPI